MMDGTQIGDISDHLNKVKHPYRGKLCEYFGGYNIVFMGNFDQLPPVTRSALYKDLLQIWIENIKDTPTKSKMTNALSPDHPRYQGLRAFSQLILHTLTTNKRSKDDPAHVAWLDNMRDSNNPEPVCDQLIEYLCNQQISD